MTELPIGQNKRIHCVPFFIIKPLIERFSKASLTLWLSLCCIIALQCAVAVNAMDASEWTLLSRGKVVVKQNTAPANTVPAVEAKILIARPMEKVWSIVSNPEKLMSAESKVKKVKILSQEGNQQKVSFSVIMTHLLPTFNYILEQNLSPPTTVKFHRLSGSFRDIQGFWRLTPAEDGKKTVLIYNLKLDPGPLIPRGLVLGAVKADLPNMLQSVKRTIEQNTN